MMKVLVQDLDSRRFLSANGGWVADKDDARDFYSLLPAYHYARDHTSRRFQVLLYSPDDNFCARMISGSGIAHQKTKIAVAGRPEENVSIPVKTGLSWFNGILLPARCNDAQRHRN